MPLCYIIIFLKTKIKLKNVVKIVIDSIKQIMKLNGIVVYLN